MGATGLRGEEVHEETELDPVVVGDEVEDASGEVIDEVEKSEDDPVSEPFLIVSGRLSLECLNTLKSGVQHSDCQGKNGRSEKDECHEETHEEACTEDDSGFDAHLLSELLNLGDLVGNRAQGLQFLVDDVHYITLLKLLRKLLNIYLSLRIIYSYLRTRD